MDKIAILDIDSIAFAIGWGNKIPDGKGDYQRDEKGRLIYQDKTEEELKECSNRIISDILMNCEATHYIGFIKGKNSASHRYSAKSDYKANRPKESPKWWSFVKNYLIENFNIHPVDNIEVDDAVNITRLVIPGSFMVAIDKDLLNLEGTHFNWRTNEWITVDEPSADYSFWFDMITGQPGDGVAGLPKYGKVAAGKLLDPNSQFGYEAQVLFEYIKVFGKHLGIQEYYKNYTCLKILDKYEGFEVPKYLPVFKSEVEQENSSAWWEE